MAQPRWNEHTNSILEFLRRKPSSSLCSLNTSACGFGISSDSTLGSAVLKSCVVSVCKPWRGTQCPPLL